jgi:hypothetical protein
MILNDIDRMTDGVGDLIHKIKRIASEWQQAKIPLPTL